MKAVLDTNVLVSGMINPNGPPGQIIDRVRAGVLTLVVDDRILAEYAEVLRRDELKPYFSESDVEAILDYLEHSAHRVLAIHRISGLPDSDDIPFLEVALAAEAPLITGNTEHFPREGRHDCVVLNPSEFVTRL